MEERVSLIVKIFSDRDQVEMVKNLCGDDAQTFVDMMDEASFGLLSLTKGWHPLNSTFCRLGIGYACTGDPQEVFAQCT